MIPDALAISQVPIKTNRIDVGGGGVRRAGAADVGCEGGGAEAGCDPESERRPAAPGGLHARRLSHDHRSRSANLPICVHAVLLHVEAPSD